MCTARSLVWVLLTEVHTITHVHLEPRLNEWSYKSSPYTCLHGVDRQTFTFSFTCLNFFLILFAYLIKALLECKPVKFTNEVPKSYTDIYVNTQQLLLNTTLFYTWRHVSAAHTAIFRPAYNRTGPFMCAQYVLL